MAVREEGMVVEKAEERVEAREEVATVEAKAVETVEVMVVAEMVAVETAVVKVEED